MKIFSVDAETDGLYGDVWAIGAYAVDDNEDRHMFAGQLDPDVVTDPWVRQNIVPIVNRRRFETREDLLNAFWNFWINRGGGAIAVADYGAPVESGLFRACVDLDQQARQWQGPYPLHELATALLMAGVDPDVDRREFSERPDLIKHDPLDDAIASGICFQKVMGTRA